MRPSFAKDVPDLHYDDVIMGAIASQITSHTIVYSTVLFRRRSKRTSKLRVTGLCVGNLAGTGEFPAQMASNAENVSISWRHHGVTIHAYIWEDNKVVARIVFILRMRLLFRFQGHIRTLHEKSIHSITKRTSTSDFSATVIWWNM